MGKAATVDNGPLFEVRRDIDVGPRTLKRGGRISLAELERLAPTKVGPLRRTGIVRLVGETDRERIQQNRDAKADLLRRASLADSARIAELRGRKPSQVRLADGGSDEQI